MGENVQLVRLGAGDPEPKGEDSLAETPNLPGVKLFSYFAALDFGDVNVHKTTVNYCILAERFARNFGTVGARTGTGRGDVRG
jgi:hypothetical protein